MPNAWRYGDWVVRMLNRDLPLNKFIVLQPVGNLLSTPSDESSAEDLLIATGMLMIGPKMLAEQDKETMIVDEQIDTVSRTMLGLPVGCARCHDHKFDPVSTSDYYVLAGISYSSLSMADRAFVSKWMEHPLPSMDIDMHRKTRQPLVDQARAEFEQLKAELKGENAEPVKKQKEALERLEKEMPQFEMVMSVLDAQPKNLPVHIRGNHLAPGPEPSSPSDAFDFDSSPRSSRDRSAAQRSPGAGSMARSARPSIDNACADESSLDVEFWKTADAKSLQFWITKRTTITS